MQSRHTLYLGQLQLSDEVFRDKFCLLWGGRSNFNGTSETSCLPGVLSCPALPTASNALLTLSPPLEYWQGSPWRLHQKVNGCVSFSSRSVPSASGRLAFLSHVRLLAAVEWFECSLKILVPGEREKPIIFSWWLIVLDEEIASTGQGERVAQPGWLPSGVLASS